jgi:lipoprotein LprG
MVDRPSSVNGDCHRLGIEVKWLWILVLRSGKPAALLAIAAAVCLAGCSSAPALDRPPEELVWSAADRMRGMSGFRFLIEREGAPAFLDVENTLSFRRAEGEYAAPDRVRAEIRVIAPGMVAEIRVISIGRVQWETNFLTGEWEELPPGWGFNPAVLFDPESGIQEALVLDLTDVVLVGAEELVELPGQTLFHLRGAIEGGRLFEVSYGMIGPDPAEAELWIAPETYELHRLLLVEPGEEEDTIWTIDFWDFDQAAEISPPSSEGA